MYHSMMTNASLAQLGHRLLVGFHHEVESLIKPLTFCFKMFFHAFAGYIAESAGGKQTGQRPQKPRTNLAERPAQVETSLAKLLLDFGDRIDEALMASGIGN